MYKLELWIVFSFDNIVIMVKFIFYRMFKFLSYLGRLIIPILVITFSILTMLPESSLHIETLRNDNFYSKVAKEISPNVFNLSDENLNRIGISFLSRDTLLSNQALVKTINDKVDSKRIESIIRDTTESQLRNIESTFKSNSSTALIDIPIVKVVQPYILQAYNFRFLLVLAILAILLFVLIFSIFQTNKHFKQIAKFYYGLTKNSLLLNFLAFIGLTGVGYVGSATKDFAKNIMGINTLSINLLDILNMQWAKFIFYLLAPSIAFAILTAVLTVLFWVLSLFQRDSKDIDKLNTNLRKQDLEIVDSTSTNSSVPAAKLTSNSYPNIEPIDVNISNKPISIPDPKPRENLDPFLNRLSQSIANEDDMIIDDAMIEKLTSTNTQQNSSQKIFSRKDI
jgi:hypothetical protein